jgi:hypothetical protein
MTSEAEQTGGPLPTSIGRGVRKRLLDLIHVWLMELGITTA